MAAALGSKVEQASVVTGQLREEEAAPVANLRVVNPELVTVIAKGERLSEIPRQRLEPAEVAGPLVIIQDAQTDPPSPSAIQESRLALRKVGRPDRVIELLDGDL